MTREITNALILSFVLNATLSAQEKAPGPSGSRTRPNILYIMTDQQPLGGVAAYGNPVVKTPELDTLARSGCVFDKLYIVAFPCTPSRASMLSGRYAHHHGLVTNEVLFDAKIPCLGDIYKAAGYQTAYFGKWHLGGNMYRMPNSKKKDGIGDEWYFDREESDSEYKFKKVPGGLGEDSPQHGFDTWAGGWKQYRDYLNKVGLGELLKKYPSLGNHNDAPSGKEGTHMYSEVPAEHHVEAFLVKQTERFVRDRAGKSQPWCAVLSFFGPHLPVAPPKPWDTMYSLDQIKLPDNHRDNLEGKPAGQQSNDHCYMLPKWNTQQYKDYIRRYWGYCSYIDQQIGRVFKTLRETNQWDNTIVVFTTDHGDMVGAHGMIYKLGSCGYEELFHVPTIVRIPGITKPGSRTDALVCSIDVLPTLLDASQISHPAGIDGQTLIPLLKGETAGHRDAVFSDSINRSFITYDGRYKFVLNWNPRELDELYDLPSDPGEMKNLAYVPEHKELASKLTKRIVTWLRETKHPYVHQIAEQIKQPPQTTRPATMIKSRKSAR